MSIRTREELIGKYIDFFKARGHKEIPSSPLIPENDPSVLFTTAGMHPLVPYLLGQKHPLGRRIVSVQKCIRTGDIDRVGDEVHHTFFEMLGNWSFGDYWKKEAIGWSFEFLTKVLEIPIDKLAISVFKGDIENSGNYFTNSQNSLMDNSEKRILPNRIIHNNVVKDVESAERWKLLGFSEQRIAFLSKDDNWWGPAGETGPCGPDTEMFYWSGKEKSPDRFDVKDERWVEIWNDVFMQYEKTKDGKYHELENKNVDTGMGVERTLAVLNGFTDNYKTEMFQPIIKEIEFISAKPYEGNEKAMRIIADHLRAAVFILGDERGIKPGNAEQGYVLRRLIRRAIRYARVLEVEGNFAKKIAEVIVLNCKYYDELEKNEDFIYQQLEEEENRFSTSIEKGLKKFNEIILSRDKIISGKDAFLLFQSYGFPIEMTEELAKENGRIVDILEYEKELKKHQELSRISSSGVFKSGLADDSERTTRLHTATHLLNEALRKVLGKEVKQKGSNITTERTRFDFNFSRKLSEKEIKEIENLVNRKIEEGLKVKREEMALKDALSSGAQAEFGTKYPDVVSVYTVEDSSDDRGWFSREICTGPHVRNTKEIGKFKIIKEESVAAGVRRIKASVE